MNIKEFFYFQKSDRQLLLLLLTMGVLIATLFVIAGNDDTMTAPSPSDSTAADNHSPMDGFRQEHYPRRYPQGRYPHLSRQHDIRYAVPTESEGHLFAFDPNTADSTALLLLGLKPWQVRNIYKFRAKGGIYRSPDDFARLYGLTVGQFKRLKPYIHISSDYLPATAMATPRQPYSYHDRDTMRYPVKLKPTEKIVLNTADTTMLKKVPGIGSSWARAIIGYGERLGGYTRVEQLLDFEDFPEDAIQYFIVREPHPRKINLNTLSLSQLKKHPYISYYQAKAILDYRRLKGNLTSLEQLRLLRDFTPESIERLTPYVEF